ncbi:type II toxin-antitoxin system RelE/ParE family toxin [bacterium]|nr:type II toxin-antitoxin system RelE/ParE family toxin [bacterium]
MSYSIEYAPATQRQLKGLTRWEARRILARIERLSVNPHPPGTVKLSGTRNEYRIRVGDFRVIYLIEENALLVLIVKVTHRRNAYRKR